MTTRPTPRAAIRRARTVSSLLLLSLVATACGGTNDTSQGESSASAEPAAVQELVVGVSADPWVDSEGDRKRRPSYPLNADVCETLVHLGTDYSLEPMLADSWELVGDNTYRFKLATGKTFSDGSPVTAEAVKASIDYTVAEPSIGFSFLGADSAMVVDEQTVDITPTKPNLRLIDQINHPTYVVLPPGEDPLNDPMPICSGPFKVTEYSPQEQLVVERNEEYHGKAPKLDKITFRFFPDDTTRLLALQAGKVDLVTDVPQGVLSTIEGRPGTTIEQSPVGNVTLMYVARRDAAGTPKLLDDVRLRRAVAASMDTKSFVEGLLDGNAEQVTTVAPPAILGDFADMVKGVPFDRAEAGRLLDEAGWTRQGDGIRTKDGQPLELAIIFARIDLNVAEFVQAQLREVGIDGRIKQLDAGAYRTALNSGDYDLDISQPSQNDANPAFLTALRWYSQATGMNAKIISPGPGTKFDELIAQTLSAKDDTMLRRTAAEAMRELVDVEVGGIPLSGNYRTYAMSDKVAGIEIHPSGTNQRWATAFKVK
ncbi:MAG: ABC transporter substrate-binding protein [Actinomycetota bacterium]|nr:ABC transporter substrate-binding protein [Actinomycetota bacterium]